MSRRDLEDILHDDYDIEDGPSLREYCDEEVRPWLNEAIGFAAQVEDKEHSYLAARLYVEWAIEHLENLDDRKHPYREQALKDLRNIIFRFD